MLAYIEIVNDIRKCCVSRKLIKFIPFLYNYKKKKQLNNCLKDRNTILKKRASPRFLSKNQNHPLPLLPPHPPSEKLAVPREERPGKNHNASSAHPFPHIYI